MNLRRIGASLARVAAPAFFGLHVGSVLVTGLPPEAREVVWPALAWYADGLLMTNRWGMFSRPPRTAEVVVVAHAPGGATRMLATTVQSSRGLSNRISDMRLRKILGNLAKEDQRAHHGREVLAYFCREARATDPTTARVVLGERAAVGTGDAAPSAVLLATTLLVHRCDEAVVPRRGAAPLPEGDG